jgi:ABC-2 type transport system permease protein
VLPLIVIAVVVAAHVIILALSTLVLLGDGPGLAALWRHVRVSQTAVAMLYALTAMALWHAPLYAWLLLVSAWARRSAFLWAVLLPLAIAVFERCPEPRISALAALAPLRWFTQVFVPRAGDRRRATGVDDAGPLLSTPGLWAGLLFAALSLATAVRVRRRREPDRPICVP